jgi:hypothetical protein
MRYLAIATLTAIGVLAGTNQSPAEDTILLGGIGQAQTQTLLFNGQAELEDVAYRGAVGYRGGFVGYRGAVGYRGVGVGYRGVYGYRGAYVGYRPYAYRPFVRAAYNRPFVYGGYYSPYFYASYYTPSYYYYPTDYYPQDYSYYYNPIAANPANLPNATILGSTSSYSQGPIFQIPASNRLPAANGDGTFNYDGGPGAVLPLPQGFGPAPTLEPQRPTVPYEGKLVSIPAQPVKNAYPAYGENTPVSTQPNVATTPVRSVATKTAYPAYGDR